MPKCAIAVRDHSARAYLPMTLFDSAAIAIGLPQSENLAFLGGAEIVTGSSNGAYSHCR